MNPNLPRNHDLKQKNYKIKILSKARTNVNHSALVRLTRNKQIKNHFR